MAMAIESMHKSIRIKTISPGGMRRAIGVNFVPPERADIQMDRGITAG
jgi:hypothetical protein